MKITEFARTVAKIEGKKREVSIAQILEVLKIINELTGGMLYKVVRGL